MYQCKGRMWAWLWDFPGTETNASRASVRPIQRQRFACLATMPPSAQDIDAFLKVAFVVGLDITVQADQHVEGLARLEFQHTATQRVALYLAAETGQSRLPPPAELTWRRVSPVNRW